MLSKHSQKVCYFSPPHTAAPSYCRPLPGLSFPFLFLPSDANHVMGILLSCVSIRPIFSHWRKTHSSVHIALQKNCRPRHSASQINILKVMTAWRLNTSKEQQQRRCDKRKFGEFVNIVVSKQTQTGLSRTAAEPRPSVPRLLVSFLPDN